MWPRGWSHTHIHTLSLSPPSPCLPPTLSHPLLLLTHVLSQHQEIAKGLSGGGQHHPGCKAGWQQRASSQPWGSPALETLEAPSWLDSYLFLGNKALPSLSQEVDRLNLLLPAMPGLWEPMLACPPREGQGPEHSGFPAGNPALDGAATSRAGFLCRSPAERALVSERGISHQGSLTAATTTETLGSVQQ